MYNVCYCCGRVGSHTSWCILNPERAVCPICQGGNGRHGPDCPNNPANQKPHIGDAPGWWKYWPTCTPGDGKQG